MSSLGAKLTVREARLFSLGVANSCRLEVSNVTTLRQIKFCRALDGDFYLNEAIR